MTKNNSGKGLKKYALSLFWLIIVIFLYVIIFVFSEQDGEESGSLSKVISEQCVEVLDKLSGDNWSETLKREIATDMEHPIRKLAHFSEYAVLAIAIYSLCSLWLPDNKWLRLGVVLWIFLSAAGDEWHQSFVPGRYCSVWDMLIDTSGGAFGMCLAIGFGKLRKGKSIKNKRKKV